VLRSWGLNPQEEGATILDSIRVFAPDGRIGYEADLTQKNIKGHVVRSFPAYRWIAVYHSLRNM
jgi:hypothetical protein